MRKFKFILFLIFCFSCSNEDFEADENNNDQENNLLVKSVKISGFEGNPNYGWNYTESFTYEGNKIEQVTTTNLNTNEVSITNYTYTDNLITVVNTYNQNNVLTVSTELSYDSSKRIISIISKSYYNNKEEIWLKSDISYRTDGKVLFCSNSEGEDYGSLLSFNNDGDVSSVTYRSEDDQFQGNIEACHADGFTGESKITYNENPYPFKNITGFQIFGYFDSNIFSRAQILGFNKNAIKATHSDDTYEDNWTYDFNEFGYPRNIVWIYDEDLTETIDIDYY